MTVFLRGCGAWTGGGTHGCRPTGGNRRCGAGGRGRTPPLRGARNAVRGEDGLPRQCAHWLAMTVFLRGCGAWTGGGTHGCRPTGGNRRCGAGGRGRTPPLRGARNAVRGEDGLPHQCAHWLAMTVFLRGCGAWSGGGVWSPRPTDNKKYLRAGRRGRRPLRRQSKRCGG